jgi:hypothetical protein
MVPGIEGGEDNGDELDEATELQACMDYFKDNNLDLTHLQEQSDKTVVCCHGHCE